MDDRQKFVEQIQQDIENSRKVRLWQDSINMLDTVSESIFSRSAHFILEILQNAEDAGSKLPGKREISFCVSPSRIKVTHNGAPFRDINVDAICGVRSNKRPEEGTLGYLGIGFKSVFKITDCPEIHSGGFHFKFDKNAYADPTNELWQIMPIWVGDSSEPLDESLTTFVMPFRNTEAYVQTLQELQKLDVHIFLFLKWLGKLTIVDEKTGDRIIIENLGENKRVASLRKEQKRESKTHRFAIFRKRCSVPPEVAADPSLEFYKRQAVKKREVVLAFSVDHAGNLLPIEDASALGSVSSFLPLIEERTGAKFLIQSDFLVQPGREAIQYELSWNHWLVEQAALLAEEAIEEFKRRSAWSSQFLPIFKFQEYWGQMSFVKLFGPKLQQPITAYLQDNEVYPALSGGHVNPSKAVQLQNEAEGLITDADLCLLFPDTTDMKLAASSIDTNSVPDQIQAQVQKLDLGKIARNKQLLGSKIRQPKHPEWFVKLFRAMAKTNQYYKQEPVRGSKGRFNWVDSPIFVLTDQNTVEVASSVYLREIPQDVIKLRSKFPEVDNLLSSYKLIHPSLVAADLIDFFKEHTHVQSIDYGKICRDVFLPKVRTTVQAPPKDELIAYTRLLQKGPEIREPIWAVSKTGKIKPSNQMFLGTSYSPSENWEKLSKYSLHIDFLSTEYLVGVSPKDTPAWKDFFIKLNAKESGENHDVETFAVEFVKDKMSAELSGFIPKDRQQHGYDLEAQLTKSGASVKLEVKGRKKKEEPIDLIGKEPEAARQAKLNSEAFWVCVVPNVPENPELWIVEDATKFGQANTLTIPISAWKQYGRRVI